MSDARTLVATAAIEVSTDRDQNLATIERVAREAGDLGAALVVFPECAVQGYPWRLGIPDLDVYEQQITDAEPVPGPTTDALAAVARDYEMEIVVGLTERPDEVGEAGRLYNTCVIVDASGVRARYRKIHVGGVEKCLWKRGSEWVVLETRVGRAGFLICYDLVFPEAARTLAVNGAEILIMPTAWGVGESDNQTFLSGYDLFTRTRALENQTFLVAANQIGGVGNFYGHSRIVDPTGAVLAETEAAGLAVAEIDVTTGVRRARARSWFGQVFLNDREPSLYSDVVAVHAPADRTETDDGAGG